MNPECCMVTEVELEGIEPSGSVVGDRRLAPASPEVGGHCKVYAGSGGGHVFMYTSPGTASRPCAQFKEGVWIGIAAPSFIISPKANPPLASGCPVISHTWRARSTSGKQKTSQQAADWLSAGDRRKVHKRW